MPPVNAVGLVAFNDITLYVVESISLSKILNHYTPTEYQVITECSVIVPHLAGKSDLNLSKWQTGVSLD